MQRKLWRDIGRHRAQFIAITITMFLGVTIFGATYDSFQNLKASYDTTATEYRFATSLPQAGTSNRLHPSPPTTLRLQPFSYARRWMFRFS